MEGRGRKKEEGREGRTRKIHDEEKMRGRLIEEGDGRETK